MKKSKLTGSDIWGQIQVQDFVLVVNLAVHCMSQSLLSL
jgi:hypothetical protein